MTGSHNNSNGEDDAKEARRNSAIAFELASIQKKIITVKHAELQTCVAAQIRVRLSITPAKTLDVCLQFPPDFPADVILMELKTKTLPAKFLKCVEQLVDAERTKIRASSSGQAAEVVRIVAEYFEANPLAVCVQEVIEVKKLLAAHADDRDSFKVKQSKSAVHFTVHQDAYSLEARVTVPHDYPETAVKSEILTANFPPLFCLFFAGQAAEIARRCVEAPVFVPTKKGQKKPSSKEPFVKRPSLQPVCSFLVECVKRYPQEPCALCARPCFPSNPPSEWTLDYALDLQRNNPGQLDDASTVIRVYCGHIHHFVCIDEFMKKPPFPKKCPQCEAQIYHDKWRATDKIREERWAHQQAKERELEEVIDFLA